jgi:hypothetical protein
MESFPDDRRSAQDRRLTPSVIAGSVMRRVSWSAVAAGALVAIASETLLVLFALAVTKPNDSHLSAALWGAFMGVAGFLPSGHIAGRASGVPMRTESALHGLLSWAAAVALAALFLSSVWTAVSASTIVALGAAIALTSGLAASALGGWWGAPEDVFRYPRRTPDPSAASDQ